MNEALKQAGLKLLNTKVNRLSLSVTSIQPEGADNGANNYNQHLR